MFPLALEMTPQLWGFALLAVTALSAGLVAWLQATKRAKAARVAHAAFAGIRAGIRDMELGKDQVAALEDAIRAAAKDYEVEDHVEDHLADGLATAKAA